MNNPLPLGTKVRFRDQDGWVQGMSYVTFKYDILVRDGDKEHKFPNRDREDFEVLEEER